MTKKGRPRRKEPPARFNLTLPQSLLTSLDAYAASTPRTVVIETAIRRLLASEAENDHHHFYLDLPDETADDLSCYRSIADSPSIDRLLTSAIHEYIQQKLAANAGLNGDFDTEKRRRIADTTKLVRIVDASATKSRE